MREPGEIIPVSVVHSATRNNDEVNNNAERGIDLDLDTHSEAVAGSDGKFWFKVNLDKVHCVDKVMVYGPAYTWICTNIDCSTCVHSIPELCNQWVLTVSTDEAVTDLTPDSNCKYGDTVKLEYDHGTWFFVREIAVVGKLGKIIKYILGFTR